MANEKGPVFAIVLAAGAARRFGRTKQLEEVGGIPLVRHACELAMSVCGDRVLLVTGHDRTRVIAATDGTAKFFVANEDYADGMGGSIAAGVKAVAHAANAILLLLADQPLITTAHLTGLVQTWSGADNAIVATAFDDTLGPPVLFPRASFDSLQRLSGDIGARSVLQDPAFDLKSVTWEDAAIDIDMPEDLTHL